MRFLPLLLLAFVSSSFATVQIQTTDLPNGILNDGYKGVLTVSGGCSPYTWSITSGSLPPGVTMNASTGTKLIFSGKPTKAATYSFTVSATGCTGTGVKQKCTIVVQSKSDHTVSLSWDASTTSDIVGYNIYRGPDGKTWSKIKSVNSSTSYSDATVADSSTYFYAATAVDSTGAESKKSNIAQSTIP